MTIVGAGAGIAELIALAVTSELAPTRKRGKYVGILIFTIVPFVPSGLYAQIIACEFTVSCFRLRERSNRIKIIRPGDTWASSFACGMASASSSPSFSIILHRESTQWARPRLRFFERLTSLEASSVFSAWFCLWPGCSGVRINCKHYEMRRVLTVLDC